LPITVCFNYRTIADRQLSHGHKQRAYKPPRPIGSLVTSKNFALHD